MDIPRRIAQLVRKHGSLRAVSRETGVDVGYLSRLRSGEKANPSEETLGRLGIQKRSGRAWRVRHG
jgi:transcriptional regulator with XRE-family HTH domain